MALGPAAVTGMQTRRTAAAGIKAVGAGRPGRRAGGAVRPAVPSRRRYLAMTGPGGKRVPSVAAIQGALRHSRIVRMMRVVLPALALLVIGVVMLQAFMYEADDTLKLKYARAGSLADDLKMLQPELSALFGKDSPFSVRADSAARDGRNLVLDKIRADFNISGESRLSLTASKGVVDTKAARIVLGPGLALDWDRGYRLHTESAIFDTRAGTVSGQSEVKFEGPAGTARADRFSVLDDGKRIRLDGNVRTTFVPGTPPSG